LFKRGLTAYFCVLEWSETVTMTTPKFPLTPDFTPVARLMGMQARIAMQTSESVMRLAYLPWKSWSTSFGSLRVQQMIVEAATPAPADQAKEPEPTVENNTATAEIVELTPVAAPEVIEPVAETTAAPVTVGTQQDRPEPETQTISEEEIVATTTPPTVLDAPRDDAADDLTLLKGVGPKLAVGLNKAGIYHFDQIAAWTTSEVAWVDENIAGVRGRASRDGWVDQAKSLMTA
jgi:predicted flap endonuclease-1-like 5' DNA nuclease